MIKLSLILILLLISSILVVQSSPSSEDGSWLKRKYGLRLQKLISQFRSNFSSDDDFQYQSMLGIEITRDYIHHSDTVFDYTILNVSSAASDRLTVYAINMTSQQWLQPDLVDHPIWWHFLFIIVPNIPSSNSNSFSSNSFSSNSSFNSNSKLNILPSLALLNIDDGENYPSPQSPLSPFNFQPRPIALQTALLSGNVVADLHQIPNEPLVFLNDGTPRSEDDLLAFGYHQFMLTLDPLWVPLLPMAKAAVKAMDVAQEVLSKFHGAQLSRFFVAGWSKRGWTTYLVGASDDRVVGIAPCVMEIPNAQQSLLHIYRVYGYWPPAIQPYVVNNVTCNIYTPQFQLIRLFIDPMVYRDGFRGIPKFMGSASGDQFFPPDNAWFGEQALSGGERHHYFGSNENHMLTHADVPDNMGRLFTAFAQGVPRPSYNWTAQGMGSGGEKNEAVLTFTPLGDQLPYMVKLYQCTNATARDFRLAAGAAYTNQYVLTNKGDVYSVQLQGPAQGWTAFYMEVSYVYPQFGFLKITTIPFILPAVVPFPDPVEVSDLPELNL